MHIRQICLVAHDLEPAVSTLCEVLGLEVGYRDPGVGVFGLHNAVMPLGTQFLEVVSPTGPDTSAGRFLERRGGDGGYMVILQTDDLANDRKRLEASGARIVWETTLDDIATVHVHPRDFGGAIVSLDQPIPPDSWRWGGPEWRSKSRTDVVRAIRAAQLQSADPAALSGRWSTLLGRPSADGALSLEGGAIRFQSLADDRGDGLAGVVLECANPDRALEAARAKNLPVDGNTVTLCGTRFSLEE